MTDADLQPRHLQVIVVKEVVIDSTVRMQRAAR